MKYLLSIAVVMFTLFCTVGMIMFANMIACEFNGWVSIPVFFVVLIAEILSLIGYMYALKHTN